MANLIYNEGMRVVLDVMVGAVDLSELGAMLVRDTYVPDPDHVALDEGTPGSPVNHEITVAGYTRQTLSGKVTGKDTATDFAYLDADDVSFGSLVTGQTIGGCIVFRETGTDTTRIPVLFFDLPDTPTNGSPITVKWAAPGVGGLLRSRTVAA